MPFPERKVRLPSIPVWRCAMGTANGHELTAECRLRLGHLIRQERGKQRRTQYWLAEKAGYNERTIRNVERGAAVDRQTLGDVCHALEIDLDAFLEQAYP